MANVIPFNQIEAFRAVVLSGTTVAAAQMLHTTQPSISRLIGQIQRSSGLKLFTNDRGRLKLTREGGHLFNTIQQEFQGLDRITQTISSLKSSGQGVFRIACTPSLGQSIVPATIKKFIEAHPTTHFDIQTLGSQNIAERLRQGMYDIAVTNSDIHFSPKEFEVSKVHKSEAVCVFSKEHRFMKLRSVEIGNLANELRISLPRNDQLEVEISKLAIKKNLSLNNPIETIYSSTICAFAHRGIGVGVVNPYMASVFKSQLGIRRFSPKIEIETFAISSKFSPASEFAEQFTVELKNQLRLKEWSLGQITSD
jgi:DNA-binding transcriptional LysR family regulator